MIAFAALNAETKRRLKRLGRRLASITLMAVATSALAVDSGWANDALTESVHWVNERGYYYAARILTCDPSSPKATRNGGCIDIADGDEEWSDAWDEGGSGIVIDPRGYVLTAGHVLHSNDGLTKENPSIKSYVTNTWTQCNADYVASTDVVNPDKLSHREIRVILDHTSPDSREVHKPEAWPAQEVAVMYHKNGNFDISLLKVKVDGVDSFKKAMSDLETPQLALSAVNPTKSTKLFMAFPFDFLRKRSPNLNKRVVPKYVTTNQPTDEAETTDPIGKSQLIQDGTQEEAEGVAMRGYSGAGLVAYYEPHTPRFYLTGILEGGKVETKDKIRRVFSWLACLSGLVPYSACSQTIVFTAFDSGPSQMLWPLFASIPPSKKACDLIDRISDPKDENLSDALKKRKLQDLSNLERISLIDFMLDDDSKEEFYSSQFDPIYGKVIGLRGVQRRQGGAKLALIERLYPCRERIYRHILKGLPSAIEAFKRAFFQSEVTHKKTNARSLACDLSKSYSSVRVDTGPAARGAFSDAVGRAANGRSALLQFAWLRDGGHVNLRANQDLLDIAGSDLDSAISYFEAYMRSDPTQESWRPLMMNYVRAIGDDDSDWDDDAVGLDADAFLSALYAYKAYRFRIEDELNGTPAHRAEISGLTRKSLNLDPDNALALSLAGEELYSMSMAGERPNSKFYRAQSAQLSAYATTVAAESVEQDDDWQNWPAKSSDPFESYVVNRSPQVKGMTETQRIRIGANAKLDDSLGLYMSLGEDQ